MEGNSSAKALDIRKRTLEAMANLKLKKQQEREEGVKTAVVSSVVLGEKKQVERNVDI